MSAATPTNPRSGRFQCSSMLAGGAGSAMPVVIFTYSNFQSGSLGCFRSHRGRLLRTTGSFSKLYSGGGELVVHSSVHPSHGSSPASWPERSECTTFTKNVRIERAWKKTPMVSNMFQNSQPRPGAYV